MVKIIVAFGDAQSRAKLASALEGAGLPVFRRCATGDEVLLTLNDCQDGVVICGAKLPDRTATELLDDIGPRALMLVVARPEALRFVDNPNAFQLSAPFTSSELGGAVNMLLQLYQMRFPKRSHDEKELIKQAKACLMAQRGLTEAQAHQALQRASMRERIKMADCARRVLQEGNAQ